MVLWQKVFRPCSRCMHEVGLQCIAIMGGSLRQCHCSSPSYPLNLSRFYAYFHYAPAYHVSTMPTSSFTPPYTHISPPMSVITLLSPIPVFPHHVPLMKNPWKLRLMALMWTLWDCLARYLSAKVNKPDQRHVELIEAVMRSEKMLTPSLNKPTSDAVIETSGNEALESQPI